MGSLGNEGGEAVELRPVPSSDQFPFGWFWAGILKKKKKKTHYGEVVLWLVTLNCCPLLLLGVSGLWLSSSWNCPIPGQLLRCCPILVCLFWYPVVLSQVPLCEVTPDCQLCVPSTVTWCGNCSAHSHMLFHGSHSTNLYDKSHASPLVNKFKIYISVFSIGEFLNAPFMKLFPYCLLDIYTWWVFLVIFGDLLPFYFVHVWSIAQDIT